MSVDSLVLGGAKVEILGLVLLGDVDKALVAGSGGRS